MTGSIMLGMSVVEVLQREDIDNSNAAMKGGE